MRHRQAGAILSPPAWPGVRRAAAWRQQAETLKRRPAISLARRWHQQGQRAEAYALLAPVYSWFTEGFDTAALQEAKALLEALA